MASFVSTGEYYYKSFDVFKKKTGEFFKNVEIMQDHLPSMIQRLPSAGKERSCLNILSVGSGTGEMDAEILNIVKQEVERSQGCHEMKIFNRAIEPNEYPCDLYKAAVKARSDQHTSFDLRHQTFEEYKERPKEPVKFDIVHFIHSIYYVDMEEALKHCVDNELSINGCVVFIVEREDLVTWVLNQQRFPDWYGRPGDNKEVESFETAEKMFEITGKHGWKHEVYSHEYSIDVTDVFDAASTEGNLLLDFLTHTKNFREEADKQLVEKTLSLIREMTTVKDGKHLGEKKESLIFIYK